jgi:amidohydrolase
MEDILDIDRRVAGVQEEMIRLRRDFHRHPELGFQETRTAGVIAGYLQNLGMEVHEGIGKTGVVGILRGGAPGKTLMLRADMDALPIQEKGASPYRSANPGVMHACGHDGHMAILLGTASVMSGLRRQLRGQIKFVFQPAEEGSGGARRMIEDGVLDNPRVDAAFGLHLITALPCGTVGWGTGIIMAAMDSFTLRIKGRSGHSSMPEGGVDAIAVSARIIAALQESNAAGSGSPAATLVNIGTIRGGDASNVIAEKVELTGTVRNLDSALRAAMPASLGRIVGRITEEAGASFDLDYQEGYPPVVNDRGMTDLIRRVAGDTLGKDKLLELPPLMASEDMAFYLERVPGCFFFLGAGNPDKGITSPLHSSVFDFDESAMAAGAALFTRLAAAFLE